MKIRKVLIVVAVLFLSVVLFFGVQIANFINKMEESDTVLHAEEACMPQYAYVSDRYGMINYHGSTYYAFETKKYSSIDKLRQALPAGCEQAVKNAVNNGAGEDAKDIKDKYIVRYEVSQDELPLVKKDPHNDTDFHFCVYVYPNNSYRFALIIETIYLR